MSLYRSFIEKISAPLIFRRDGMHHVLSTLSELESSQYWSSGQILVYQYRRLKALLTHAYENTEFYRKRFDDASFNPTDFKKVDDLIKIPPLTRYDLQTQLNKLVARNYKRNEIHMDATGGSTGCHTPFFRDNACLGFKKAIEFRCNKWAGWKPGDKIAYYWPAIQDFAKKIRLRTMIKNALSYRALMLYSGKLNEATLENHYKELKKFSPALMRAFPNPLSVFAKYIKETNKEPLHIPAIISVGEPLLESQRRLFSEVFGSKVYNCYVSRECGNMACECGNEPGVLHVNAEMLFIEFENNTNETDEQPKKLLITDLVNYGMPFIRYRIEDMGIPVDTKCSCGRGLPLMNMDAGRISDFLISPVDHSRVSGCGLLHHMIAEGPEVGQIQIIQDKINHLEIRIRKSESFSQEKLYHFDKVLKEIFKGRMAYDVKFVDKIDHQASGKYLFTKCLISDER